MIFHVKNMVCDRCRTVVRQTFEQMGFAPLRVDLGEVETARDLPESSLQSLSDLLQQHGFALLENPREQLVERVKTLLIQVARQEVKPKTNLSDFLVDAFARDYGSLSALFSADEGTTIEQFLIRQKIERVKELIAYNELTMSQIANVMQYSSVAHLSNQFKKMTGQTPSDFRQQATQPRVSLDKLAAPK